MTPEQHLRAAVDAQVQRFTIDFGLMLAGGFSLFTALIWLVIGLP